MDTRPLHPELGVEVSGFDASARLSAEDVRSLNELFDRHRLLLVRGQDIDAATQIRLVEAIAPVTREGSTGKDYSFTGATKEDAYVFGRQKIIYHSDYLFVPHGPIQVVSLCALVMDFPEPTLFTDSVAAARALPDDLRDRLRELNVVQFQPWDLAGTSDGSLRYRMSAWRHLPPESYAMGVYPALSRHPRTGEEVLMHCEQVTSHFEGLTEAESDEIFAEIAKYQYAPDGVYQHDWQLGDLLIWDNIALQHGRPKLAPNSERLLRRVAGNPIPVSDIMAGVVPDNPMQRTAGAPA